MSKLFIAALLSFISYALLLAQNPRDVVQDTLLLSDIQYSRFDTISPFPSLANMLVVDDKTGIIQIGQVEILRLNLEDGNTEDVLDMRDLHQYISNLLLTYHEGLKISDTSSFKGKVKPEHFPIWFSRIKSYGQGDLYYTMTTTSVTQTDTASEEEKFRLNALLVFNRNLDIVDFIPFMKNGTLALSKYSDRGGYYFDKVLLKRQPLHRYADHYVFIKYVVAENNLFQSVDTFSHWPHIKWLRKGGFIKDNFINCKDSLIFQLERKFIILQNWDDSGYVRKLPLKENQFVDYLKPIIDKNWYAAIVYEDNKALNNGKTFGDRDFLALIDRKMKAKLVLDEYVGLHHIIESLDVFGDKIYVLAFDRKKKEFNVFTYELKDLF